MFHAENTSDNQIQEKLARVGDKKVTFVAIRDQASQQAQTLQDTDKMLAKLCHSSFPPLHSAPSPFFH